MRRVAALLAAFLLTSCAATESAAPSATAVPSIPPGLEQIAAAYLKAADSSNAATCTFNAVLSQSAPALADLKRASIDYAESLEGLADGLTDIEWPAELEADATELIDALAVNQGFAEAMARAATLSAFIEADNQLIEANAISADAAAQLRTDLGLGSARNPCR